MVREPQVLKKKAPLFLLLYCGPLYAQAVRPVTFSARAPPPLAPRR